MIMTERHTQDGGDWISPAVAANMLGVHYRTVARMADRGEIEVLRVGTGNRRYKRADVQRYVDEAHKTGQQKTA